MIAAISASDSWSPKGVIALLNLVFLTVMSPWRPWSTMRIGTSGLLSSHSEPASGGYAPGTPSPVAWWQAAHRVNSSAPLGAAATPPAATGAPGMTAWVESKYMTLLGSLAATEVRSVSRLSAPPQAAKVVQAASAARVLMRLVFMD